MKIHADLQHALESIVSWDASIGYDGSVTPFGPDDIVELFDLHIERGDYQDTQVWASGLTRDGRYFLVYGWCDTTGWDCASGGRVQFAGSREALWQWAMTDDDRAKLPKTEPKT